MSFIFAKIMAFITERKLCGPLLGMISIVMRLVNKASLECPFSLLEGPLCPDALLYRRVLLGQALEFRRNWRK